MTKIHLPKDERTYVPFIELGPGETVLYGGHLCLVGDSDDCLIRIEDGYVFEEIPDGGMFEVVSIEVFVKREVQERTNEKKK
jgi:hypothetical protein